MKNIVIIGTSSTAACIYQFIQKNALYKVVGFAVNQHYWKEAFFCGLPVFVIERLDEVIDKTKDVVFVAIQWNNLNADRRRVYEELKKGGFLFANLISPTAVINGSITGENCWIADLACIDFDAVINNNVFVKVAAWVGPNSKISDHCFIGAKSIVAGGVEIGEQSFVGLAAILFDEVKVGKKCIVGAATALKRNLSDFSVYKTSLNNFVTKQYSEEVIETKLQFAKNVRK